jgi:hypothetical protein
MIDYFFKWSDETAAKSDALALANFLNVTSSSIKDWAQDKVLANLQAWRPSQDVAGVHTFLTGWFAIVALPTQVPVFLNATALQFALDRDGPPYIIKNNIGVVITDVAVSPIFAGSHYPIGGLS